MWYQDSQSDMASAFTACCGAATVTSGETPEVYCNQFFGFVPPSGSNQFLALGEKRRYMYIKGVMTRSMIDTLSELCSPFLKGGNSAFIAVIASGLSEYRLLE